MFKKCKSTTRARPVLSFQGKSMLILMSFFRELNVRVIYPV